METLRFPFPPLGIYSFSAHASVFVGVEEVDSGVELLIGQRERLPGSCTVHAWSGKHQAAEKAAQGVRRVIICTREIRRVSTPRRRP